MIAEADSLENVSEAHGVTLDLSKRSKIIIYAKSREVTTKSATPRRSIFSRRLEKGAPREECQGGTPTEDVDLGQQPKQTPKQSAMPNSTTGGGRSGRQESMKRADRLEYDQLTQTNSPMIFAIKRPTPTKYAAECANCPCSFQGRSPCQRCRLLLLADRFCNLVDTQCEKWKSEPMGN